MKKIIFPFSLKTGDTIAVFCASRLLYEKDFQVVDLAIENLQKLGFNVVMHESCKFDGHCDILSPQARAKIFMDYILDNNIKCILSAKGGQDSNAIFDYIDYKAIKKNPKIILGYSDFTKIVNKINYETGLVTFLGPNLKLYGHENSSNFCLNDFSNKFIHGDLSIGRQSDTYEIIKNGYSKAKSIGGTISSLSVMFDELNKNIKNKILLIEEFAKEAKPIKINGLLYQMHHNKIFDKVRGIWIGSYETNDYKIADTILDMASNQTYPIIKSNNYGHVYENSIIPIGHELEINTKNIVPVKIIKKMIK